MCNREQENLQVYTAGTESVRTSDRSLGLGPADDDGALSNFIDVVLCWSIRSCAGVRTSLSKEGS